MQYDVINYGGEYSDDPDFYTIRQLMDIASQYPEHIFKFIGTDYSPEELMSWRGSYDLPAISYSFKQINGQQLLEMLIGCLNTEHYGYKGGQYKYHDFMEFYVSAYGCAEEYKVCGHQATNTEVVLLTKLDPY